MLTQICCFVNLSTPDPPYSRLVPTASTKRSSAKTTGDDPQISDVSGEKDAPDPDETTQTASNINIDPNESEAPDIENDPDKIIKSTPTASLRGL